MFGGLFVSASMLGMLRDFIEKNRITAPECLQAMERYSPTSRLALDEWSKLLHMIALRYPRPALGLAIGACVAPKHVGIMGYMALSCNTVGEALLRYARYQRLVYDGNPGSIIADGDALEIRWGVERGVPGPLVDETAIAMFLSYVRFLVEEPLRPLLVTFFNPPPADLKPYTDFFGCPVHFGDTVTRMRFPISSMTRELRQRDPALMELLSQQAEALLVALPAADSFYDRLRSSIVKCVHDGNPDLPAVAGLMAMLSGRQAFVVHRYRLVAGLFGTERLHPRLQALVRGDAPRFQTRYRALGGGVRFLFRRRRRSNAQQVAVCTFGKNQFIGLFLLGLAFAAYRDQRLITDGFFAGDQIISAGQ